MPSDYSTLAAVKQSLNRTTEDDDAFLEALITRASRMIDDYCQRFFVGETQTRNFDAVQDVYERTLYLDEDLLSVDVIQNGDGTTITASQYVFEPRNRAPKHGITLKSGTADLWTYFTDPENAISVTGTWGYSAGTPDAIQQATNRLVIWWFKQRSSPFTEVGTTDAGLATINPSMPNDIRLLLQPFIKVKVRML